MKASKKLKILKKSCGTYDYCKFYFKHSDYEFYHYVLDFNERLCLCALEDDFIIDGYTVCRLRDIKYIKIVDNATVEINRRNGILDELEPPRVDITSWKTVFGSLEKTDLYIVVQNEYSGFYRIGKIKRVKKSSVVFKAFDGDGVWQPKIKIPFSDITSVQFGNRYSTFWREHLTRSKK